MSRNWRTGAFLLAATGWAAGCGPAMQEEEAQRAQEAGNLSGVVLEPNLIRGRARFTNSNPEILAILDGETRTGIVSASSTQPMGYSGRTEVRNAPNLRGFDFEMSVESAAAGSTGMLYTVSSQWSGRYNFQALRNVLVQPRSVQPDGARVDINECIGVLKVTWGTDNTCSTPTPVREVSVGNFAYGNVLSGRLHHFIYTPAGTRVSESPDVTFRVGTDAQVDLRSYIKNISYDIGCDEVVNVCIPVPGPGEVGALTGPWDVVGEEPVHERIVNAQFGPDGNYRLQRLTSGVMRSPAEEPSTWWTLPNMVPGDYTLQGSGYVRRGRELTQFRTSSVRPATVVVNQTTAVRDALGRYPFVMNPATFSGSIRLADPYLRANPGAGSTLQALFFEANYDSNGDGIPNFPTYFSPNSRYGTSVRATSTGSAFSATSFPGQFDAARGEFTSGYQLLLPNVYNATQTWNQDVLRLGFWSQGESFVTKPGMYDPVTFRYGRLDLSQRQRTATLASGQQGRVDHEYCFNEVQLELSTTGDRFFNPTVSVVGSFRGTDWRGMSADYSAAGLFNGVPAALGVPTVDGPLSAQSRGSVRLVLPQGSFTLGPGAQMVSPTGTINSANFQPIQVTVGCGQRLRLVPPLSVNLQPVDTCAPGSTVTMQGSITSGQVEVDHVWYTLNDGPPVTVCTQCGFNPAFSFPVELGQCQNTVRVYAYTEGMPMPAEGFQHLVWDDPMDRVYCEGSTCQNRAPHALCRDVEVSAGAQCGASVSVDNGSFDPEDIDVECTQSPAGPLAPGQHTVTLTCTDSQGESSSCQATVTVKDDVAPAVTCSAPTVLECTGAGTQAAFAATAQDNCGGALPVTCTPGTSASFPPGTTPVTCTATDSAGNQGTCQTQVSVVDTTPPAIHCPAQVVVDCSTPEGAQVTPPPATATDGCSTVSVTGPAAGTYPVGTTPVTYTATDAAGNTASCTTSIQVRSSGSSSGGVVVTRTPELWPPNHKYHTVSLADCGIQTQSACGSGGGGQAPVSAAITCVSSDEAVDAQGSGNTDDDIVLVDATTVKLRAERSGNGDGRVYRIQFTAKDAAGNTVPGVCKVVVPHDRSGGVAQAGPEAYQVCRP